MRALSNVFTSSEIDITISVSKDTGADDTLIRTNANLRTGSSFAITLEGGTRPISLTADGYNNALGSDLSSLPMSMGGGLRPLSYLADGYDNSSDTTRQVSMVFSPTVGQDSLAIELMTDSTNPWRVAFLTGESRTLTFNIASLIAWAQGNSTGAATLSTTLPFTMEPPAVPSSLWAWNNTGVQTISGGCVFNLVKLYLFADARTQCLPAGALTLAGQTPSDEESNTIFITARNNYAGVYPLPKAIPVNWMSTTEINTGLLTKEIQFFLNTDIYNDSATGGVSNVPSFFNIYVASSYVSPDSTLTNLQVIQRSRQVWLTS